MRAITLIFSCVVGAVLFGIAHDMVTAHVHVEYFTVHHPKVVESQSPVIMALVWGVLATWWMGLFAGLIVASTDGYVGRVLPIPRVLRALGTMLVALWTLSMAVLGLVSLLPSGGTQAQQRLMAVSATHLFSYSAATVAMIGFAVWIARASRALSR